MADRSSRPADERVRSDYLTRGRPADITLYKSSSVQSPTPSTSSAGYRPPLEVHRRTPELLEIAPRDIHGQHLSLNARPLTRKQLQCPARPRARLWLITKTGKRVLSPRQRPRRPASTSPTSHGIDPHSHSSKATKNPRLPSNSAPRPSWTAAQSPLQLGINQHKSLRPSNSVSGTGQGLVGLACSRTCGLPLFHRRFQLRVFGGTSRGCLYPPR